MKVRSTKGRSYKHSDETGAAHFTAEALTQHAVEHAAVLAEGQTERVQAKLDALTEIVGRLVEQLPESQWLEVLGLQYSFEQA